MLNFLLLLTKNVSSTAFNRGKTSKHVGAGKPSV